jgi:hypothetical protein
MISFAVYNTNSLKEAKVHFIEGLLQAVPCGIFIAFSQAGFNYANSVVHPLRILLCKDAIIELYTGIGFLPPFNLIGYAILKDTYIPTENTTVYLSEVYSQKAEFINKAAPLLFQITLEYQTGKEIIGVIYSKVELATTAIRTLTYGLLDLYSNHYLNETTYSFFLREQSLHKNETFFIGTLALPSFLFPIINGFNIRAEIFNELYIEASKNIEFYVVDLLCPDICAVWPDTFESIIKSYSDFIIPYLPELS